MVIFYISFFRLCSWRKKCQNVNYYNDVLLCFVQIVGRDTLSIIYIDYQTCKLFLYSRLHWCAIYFTVILPRTRISMISIILRWLEWAWNNLYNPEFITLIISVMIWNEVYAKFCSNRENTYITFKMWCISF